MFSISSYIYTTKVGCWQDTVGRLAQSLRRVNCVFPPASSLVPRSTRPSGLRSAGVDRLTFGRRIGVHDLEDRSTRLRVEGFVDHKQCRPRRQYSINSGCEVGGHFYSGNRVRIYLSTLFSDVTGHADPQPTEFGWIGNVGIGHAARALAENQCVIDERRIAGDG